MLSLYSIYLIVYLFLQEGGLHVAVKEILLHGDMGSRFLLDEAQMMTVRYFVSSNFTLKLQFVYIHIGMYEYVFLFVVFIT